MRVNEREDNVTVDEFEVADPADAWTRAGFSVDSDAVCRIGGVRIRLTGPGRGAGIVGWSLRGLPSDGSLHDLDGIPTTRSDAVAAMPAEHPNGVLAIDHVVLLSPDLRRTVESLTTVGVERAESGTANSADDQSARSSSGPGRSSSKSSVRQRLRARVHPPSGGSRTSSRTSTRPPPTSVIAQHRSRMRCNPDAGSRRSGITSS